MPRLKAVFYGAGTVKEFAIPLLEREILVTSSWAANAVPVAEFTLSQILLANKGYWHNLKEYASREHGAFHGRGSYGSTVSLLGAGQVGRRVIELLCPFQLRVVVFDPFLNAEEAQDLGVQKVETLEEAFAHGDVVSNHLADVAATRGLINGARLRSMPQGATFINTGRGNTVVTDDLVAVCQERPDLTALLDVTTPEPLPLSHPLRELPNVHLTSHIAGSLGDEVARMGEVAVEEFEAWRRGHPLRYAVSLKMLEMMA